MRQFKNPILDNIADPDVIFHDGLYYLYATSGTIGTHGYEVYSSADLVNWEKRGEILRGAWGIDSHFWAPDIKEKDGKFYMLVTASEHLGLAVSDSPLGPFEPQNGFLFDHTIDGHIFFDGDDMYIYYVSWRDGHTYGIYGCKMLPDRITPDLSTEKLLLVHEHDYERHQAGVVEAPYMLKKDGVYYLTYSACHYESPLYCVCYATSDSPLGDFVKYEGNPILVGDGKTVSGAGHHCITFSPDKNRMIILYHTHKKPGTIHPRVLAVGGIRFEEKDGRTVLVCDRPDTDFHRYPLD